MYLSIKFRLFYCQCSSYGLRMFTLNEKTFMQLIAVCIYLILCTLTYIYIQMYMKSIKQSISLVGTISVRNLLKFQMDAAASIARTCASSVNGCCAVAAYCVIEFLLIFRFNCYWQFTTLFCHYVTSLIAFQEIVDFHEN